MYNNALFGKVQNVSPKYVENLGKCTNSGEMLKTYPLLYVEKWDVLILSGSFPQTYPH